MTSSFVIRPFEENHFAAFVNFRKEALLNAPESFGSDYESYNSLSLLDKEQLFEKLLNYPFNYALGTFDSNDQIVGMAGFSCNHFLKKQRHKGYIWGMYVAENYRRLGVAYQLLQYLLTSAQQDAGCEHILLSVSSKNIPAFHLYKKLNFFEYGTEYRALKLEDGYVDEILMMKYL